MILVSRVMKFIARHASHFPSPRELQVNNFSWDSGLYSPWRADALASRALPELSASENVVFCVASIDLGWTLRKLRMARRNDAAIAVALKVVAQVVGHQPNANAGANAEVRMLETFLRNHPPTFKGRYDPDGDQTWLKEIKRVFRVSSEVQKVRFEMVRQVSGSNLGIGKLKLGFRVKSGFSRIAL
ncbi:hypothetical protein MTR_0080s0060 [Medicago truncatula]|uniref:Uncharacterized protein n=1 Tax=Medicago truncatula TaxID=3880 RepID=A0A072TTM3_MEDTR|nr:hypothetical protein MTR_0080s0060 [Medicago truncatula]